MTRQRLLSFRLCVSGVVLLALPSCGTAPTKVDVSGTWTTEKVGHGDYTLLTLTQDGDQLSGFACEYSTSAPLYEGAVVSGDVREFGYTVKPENDGTATHYVAGTTFTGRVVDVNVVAGLRTYAGGASGPVSFTREPHPDSYVCPPKR
jgi:hypothetical protein